MFKTCSLWPGGYLPEVVAHGILTVSANSMFWQGRGGGGGGRHFFNIQRMQQRMFIHGRQQIIQNCRLD